MQKVIIFLFISFLLIGCSANSEAGSNSISPSPISADLVLSKKSINIGDTIQFELNIRKGEEVIKKLDEAYFQIHHEENTGNTKKVNLKRNNNGSYSFEKEFNKSGQYLLSYHVALNDQFYEETKSIFVNSEENTDNIEENSNEASHDHSETSNNSNNKSYTDENQSVSTHLMYDSNASKLITHVTLENEPLKDARVRFEIWNEQTKNKHVYLDADEGKEGEYVNIIGKSYTGDYNVVIHVEKDEIHYHKEEKVSF